MYYIYHVEGIKIGCTDNHEHRTKEQGFINYEILEEHIDVYIASDREIALQKQYGLQVDKIPYWKTIKMPTPEGRRKGGINGGKASVESGHLQRISSNAGKIAGKKNVESGHIIELGKKQGKIQGPKNKESGQWHKIRKLGPKAAGKKNVESGHISNLGKLQGQKHKESGFIQALGRKNMLIINSIQRTCPHCNLTGKGPNMPRYHFDNCKAKPE
jgi:hypothetical protein